jgi:hypothetical protein
VNAMKGISLTQVLLDNHADSKLKDYYNQADISVMYPLLLRNLRPAERKIRVSGVGGVQLMLTRWVCSIFSSIH